MSDEPPTPPTSVSTEVANALNDLPPEHLRDIARYAEKLAEHKEREDRLEEGSNEDESERRSDDLPDDVPLRATIKEINDNRYYYWQWREGDKIRSQYKGPADPDE